MSIHVQAKQHTQTPHCSLQILFFK